MAIPAIQNAPHLDRVDLLKFQYQEKLSKLHLIAQLVTKIALFLVGFCFGYGWGFATTHLFLHLGFSPVNAQLGSLITSPLLLVGGYVAWNKIRVQEKIQNLWNSWFSDYERTLQDLNNPAFTAYAHRAGALNMDQITEANQYWHNRLR